MSREIIAEITFSDPERYPMQEVWQILQGPYPSSSLSLIQADPEWVVESIETKSPISWRYKEGTKYSVPALGNLIAEQVMQMHRGLGSAEIALTDHPLNPSKRILGAFSTFPNFVTLRAPHPNQLAESIAKKQPVSWLDATEINGLTREALGGILGWEITQRLVFLETQYRNRPAGQAV